MSPAERQDMWSAFKGNSEDSSVSASDDGGSLFGGDGVGGGGGGGGRKGKGKGKRRPLMMGMEHKTDAEIRAALDEGFYTQDFDPVAYMLDRLPQEEEDDDDDAGGGGAARALAIRARAHAPGSGGSRGDGGDGGGDASEGAQLDPVLAQFFMEQISEHDRCRDIINARLSKTVMDNYEQFVQGMKHVQDVDMDLTIASMNVSNGRRKLASAKREMSTATLRLLQSKRVARRLRKVVQAASEMKELASTETVMRAALSKRDYSQAVHVCVDATTRLDEEGLDDDDYSDDDDDDDAGGVGGIGGALRDTLGTAGGTARGNHALRGLRHRMESTIKVLRRAVDRALRRMVVRSVKSLAGGGDGGDNGGGGGGGGGGGDGGAAAGGGENGGGEDGSEDLCDGFDAGEYGNILRAYLLLDEHPGSYLEDPDMSDDDGGYQDGSGGDGVADAFGRATDRRTHSSPSMDSMDGAGTGVGRVLRTASTLLPSRSRLGRAVSYSKYVGIIIISFEPQQAAQCRTRSTSTNIIYNTQCSDSYLH
jgi:hypothetical protein